MQNYARQQKQYNGYPHKALVAGCMGVVAVVLMVVNVILSADLSHIGADLQQVEGRKTDLQLDIYRLNQEINQHASLVSIRTMAGNNGFVSNYQAVALSSSASMAYHQPN